MTQTLIWKEQTDGLLPILMEGTRELPVTWAPQPGSQPAFLSCPVGEVLYEGTRGPGKTICLLMDFMQEVGKGWGAEWKGVLFRRSFPELQDVIDKGLLWFKRIFPAAEYNQGSHVWKFPDGEQLFFRHFERAQDYWKYHGHAYPWIGWEELTTWPDSSCYTSMFSCNRSTVVGMPKKVRATTNPYGVGHNWVKARWRLPIAQGRIIGPVIRDSRDREGNIELPRVAIHGELMENKVLLFADPDYISKISSAARNEQELKAWLHGDWDIVAGGMFDDVWDVVRHVVPNFPLKLIPRGWRMDRSYDHGQSAPFSVGWWAESNGEPFQYGDHVYGKVPGDLYRIAEWYGWNGRPNEGLRMLSSDIARGILEREEDYGILGRVRPGQADSSIFDDYEPGSSVAGDMRRIGVNWLPADKGPGSRKQGWEQLRKMLTHSKEPYREEPGMFILARCEQFKRTVPVLPRSDRDLDDVDTTSEDHIGDEVRYRIRRKKRETRSESWR